MDTTAEQPTDVREFTDNNWVTVSLVEGNDDSWTVRKSSVDVVGIERIPVRWEHGNAVEFRTRSFIKVRGMPGRTFVREDADWLARNLGAL